MSVSLKRLKYPEQFEVDERYSSDHEIVMRPKLSEWQRHWRWLGKHHWTARVVIVVAELTLAYLILVFGILLGAAFIK